MLLRALVRSRRAKKGVIQGSLGCSDPVAMISTSDFDGFVELGCIVQKYRRQNEGNSAPGWRSLKDVLQQLKETVNVLRVGQCDIASRIGKIEARKDGCHPGTFGVLRSRGSDINFGLRWICRNRLHSSGVWTAG